MLLSTITAKHPNSFVLLKPKSRDKQNHVRDWNVLNTAKKYDDILRIAEYYRSEGISNAVILSTGDELVVDMLVGDIMCVRHNSEGEFTSIKEDDIPIIESHLIPLMPDKMIDYEEAE